MTNDEIADLMRQVAADCATDAAALDGKPFTGRTVAESLGEVLAMVSACAKAIEALAENTAKPS